MDSTRVLLARGASWIAKTVKEQQPIHLAGDKGHKEVFNILRQAAGLQAVQGDSYYPSRNGGAWAEGSRLLNESYRSGSYRRVGTLGPEPWPTLVERDSRSRDLYVVGPEEGAYWN